jgi:hypothetical protein
MRDSRIDETSEAAGLAVAYFLAKEGRAAVLFLEADKAAERVEFLRACLYMVREE